MVPDVVAHGTKGKNMDVGSTVHVNGMASMKLVVENWKHPVPGPTAKAPSFVKGHANGGFCFSTTTGAVATMFAVAVW